MYMLIKSILKIQKLILLENIKITRKQKIRNDFYYLSILHILFVKEFLQNLCNKIPGPHHL